MKIFTTVAAITLAFTGFANAEGWQFPAGSADNYEMLPTVSFIGGTSMPAEDGVESSTLMGLELSMNCPLLQPPTNRIRQQVSWTLSDEAGVTAHSLEINPHYVVEVADNLEIGFGPGFGMLLVDAGTESKTLFGAQLGASAHYRMGAFFIGGEARYQLTTEADFGAGDMDMNNNRMMLKIGMDL